MFSIPGVILGPHCLLYLPNRGHDPRSSREPPRRSQRAGAPISGRSSQSSRRRNEPRGPRTFRSRHRLAAARPSPGEASGSWRRRSRLPRGVNATTVLSRLRERGIDTRDPHGNKVDKRGIAPCHDLPSLTFLRF
ncbi:hypothetical protein E3T41_10475 [Cryobacterium sp. Hh38]|nr:hypothetical protein E3T41_10475 [Cryobacterium sp. Hh38]